MKYVYLLFVFALIGIIPSAFGQGTIETPNSISKVVGYEDLNTPIIEAKILPYDRIDDGSTYKNYIIKETDNDFVYESASGSYSFSKTSCAASVYDGGHITGQDKEFILSHTMKQAPDGTDNWTSSPENNEACNISYVENQDGTVRFTASKGDWKTHYDISYLGQMEYTYEFKNNDFFSNDKIGFTTTCTGDICDQGKVNGQDLTAFESKTDIAGKEIQLGKFTYDTQNEQHDMLWAVKESTDKLSVDFTDSKGPVGFGESVIVDPVLTKGGVYGRTVSTNNAVGAACPTGSYSSSNATGTSTLTAPLLGASGSSAACSRFALYWDISFLPSTLTVSSATITASTATATNARNCDIRVVNQDFIGMTAANQWTDIGDGNLISPNDTWCASSANTKTFASNSNLTSSIVTRRAAGDTYIGMGVKFTDEARPASVAQDTITYATAYMTVTYSAGVPNAPSGVSCTGIPFGGSCSWTASAANNNQNSISITGQDTTMQGGFISSNGTVMYLVGDVNNKIFEYTLSQAYNITTATYTGKSLTVTSQDTTPRDIFFKSDGSKAWLVGDNTDSIFEYALSNPWEITSASLTTSKSISANTTLPRGIFINSTGTGLFFTGSSGPKLIKWTMSTPWDLSTALYNSQGTYPSPLSSPSGFFMKSDGSKVIEMGSDRYAYLHTLSPNWSVVTLTYPGNGRDYVGNVLSATSGIFTDSNNNYLYSVNSNDDRLYQFKFSTPWDIHSLTFFTDVSNGVTNYYTAYSTNNSTYSTPASVGSNTTSKTITGLSSNTLYYVRVNATNGLNNSTAGYTSFTTDTTPSAPLNPYTTATPARTIKLNWSPPSSNGGDAITQYRIENSTVGHGWDVLSNTTTTLNYNHTGLGAAYTATYRIAAWNGVGLGTYTANFTGTSDNVPDAPTLSLSQVSTSSFDAHSVAGASDGGDTVVWFGIQCEKNHAGGWITRVANASLPSNRTYTLGGAASGETYVCQWRDGNHVGFSSFSANATLTMQPITTLTLTLGTGVIGDTAQVNATVHILTGDPLNNVTQSRFYVNDVLTETRAETEQLTVGSTTTLDPFWYHGLTTSAKNVKVGITITNRTVGGVPTTSTPSSSNTALTAEYIPDYIDTVSAEASEGQVNYTFNRADANDDVHLQVNREGGTLGNTWEIDCIVQNNRQAYQTHPGAGNWQGTWINYSGTGYFNGTWDGLSGTHAYITCINPPGLLLTFTSYSNSSLALFGIQIFDDTYGSMLGVPVGVFFLVLTAGMASKRTAPTWIIVLLGFAGVMSAIGFFSLNPLVWGLALVSGLLGVLVNSKAY